MNKVDSNRINCTRFDAKTLPDSVREKCFEEFPMRNFTNEFIAYYEEDDNVEVLGYFLIKKEQITHSKYFDTFRFNCINIGGYDTDALVEKKAYQIIEWYLKDELKDKQLLYAVFEIIIGLIGEPNNIVFLWRDGKNELEFFPISNDKYKIKSEAAIIYFTKRFLQ